MPDDQRDPRVARLNELIAKGIEPYGRRYDAPNSIADCLAAYDEDAARIAWHSMHGMFREVFAKRR